MNSALNKVNRLLELEKLLLCHSEGLKRSEMASKLSVHRSTITRDIAELSGILPLCEDEDGRIVLDRDHYLNLIKLDLHEIMALHFASRLLTRRMNYQYSHAASAMQKLGLAVKKMAPLISRHMIESSDIMNSLGNLKNDQLIKNLETLTRAWSSLSYVKILHYSGKRKTENEYLFAPYYLEPYSEGHSIHVIGKCPDDDFLRVFKLERIIKVQLLFSHYDIPDDFSIQSYFGNAWGVWVTGKPEKVVLKFSPAVRSRVTETLWHKKQILKPLSEGCLEWSAEVDAPREMFHWIRGWGKDVEILTPLWLREEFRKEIEELARIYNKC